MCTGMGRARMGYREMKEKEIEEGEEGFVHDGLWAGFPLVMGCFFIKNNRKKRKRKKRESAAGW